MVFNKGVFTVIRDLNVDYDQFDVTEFKFSIKIAVSFKSCPVDAILLSSMANEFNSNGDFLLRAFLQKYEQSLSRMDLKFVICDLDLMQFDVKRLKN